MPNAGDDFRTHFEEPSDIFSVLLILGGDVIQSALAATTGGIITPVAFSFGWVAYAISALLSSFGENKLMRCAPEIAILVLNLQSGYSRPNQSWLLSRLIKTYEFWMDKEVKETIDHPPDVRDEEGGIHEVRNIALCVAVYRWSRKRKPGNPARDLVWWSGLVTTVVQLGISAVPFGTWTGQWAVFLITACGTLLAYASGALPQWRQEKFFACTLRNKKHVALTRGNGSRHVVVIVGEKDDLDLEALAAAWPVDLWSTRLYTFLLALCWLVLLVASTGIKTGTWYLLAVGGMGMLQNLVVASAPRYPASMGFPIELAKMPTPAASSGGKLSAIDDQQSEMPAIFAEEKVMWTLMEFDERFKGLGKQLVSEYFPGNLRPWEEQWWDSKDTVERKRLLDQAKRKYFAKRK
ncbi:hypothetical protein CC80DRAFT_527113 [Byssothecium circinans]|uniref:Uncharacterized protein n=1 Tax=Byssothecium circinans TaxID=147558 RepID=A0A6A5TPT4_9PLEO|nr:hypothetical protein CC80DRAFT_527113 [Byssothecium circinans]